MYKLEFKRTSNRYSKEELFDNLEKVWKHKNGQPIISDMDCYPSEICFSTYYNHFGSWKNALKEFVEARNERKVRATNKEGPKPIRVPKRMNNSLRFDVFKRDHFKCCICGSSPATNPLVELEVDHITPISKNGKTTPENLQTLCNKCNNGKGSKQQNGLANAEGKKLKEIRSCLLGESTLIFN